MVTYTPDQPAVATSRIPTTISPVGEDSLMEVPLFPCTNMGSFNWEQTRQQLFWTANGALCSIVGAKGNDKLKWKRIKISAEDDLPAVKCRHLSKKRVQTRKCKKKVDKIIRCKFFMWSNQHKMFRPAFLGNSKEEGKCFKNRQFRADFSKWCTNAIQLWLLTE